MTCLTPPIGLLGGMALGALAAAVAPAEVSFLGAIVLAVAWCRWLDAHPQTLPEDPADPQASQELLRNSLAAAQAGTPIVDER